MEFEDIPHHTAMTPSWISPWDSTPFGDGDLSQDPSSGVIYGATPDDQAWNDLQLENILLYEPTCPYQRHICEPVGEFLTLKFRLVEVFQDGSTYIGDSLGGRSYIDPEEERPCSNFCRCRSHSACNLEDNFAFLVDKTCAECTITVNHVTLLHELQSLLGPEEFLFSEDTHGKKTNGFTLLQNYHLLKERLQRLAILPANQQSQVHLLMKLLVDDFLSDGDVFRSFGFENLYERDILSFELWNSFQGARILQEVTSFENEFWMADVDEELPSIVDGQSEAPFVTNEVITQKQQENHHSFISANETRTETRHQVPLLFSHISRFWKEYSRILEKREIPHASPLEDLTLRPIRLLDIEYSLHASTRRFTTAEHNRLNDLRRHATTESSIFWSCLGLSCQIPAREVCSAIKRAIVEGHTELVKYLRGESMEFLSLNWNFWAYLLEFARDGCMDAVQGLLTFLPHQSTPYIDDTFLKAAEENDRRLIRSLLSLQPIPEGVRLQDALIQAALHGHADIVELLVDQALPAGKSAWKLILASMLIEESRRLRIRVVHKKFKEIQSEVSSVLCCKTGITFLDSLLDWRFAWKRGMATFKNILERTLPATTEEVLAFLCVSAAISSSLDAEKGFEGVSRMDLFRRDLARWESLIPAAELHNYQEIVGDLWDGYSPELVRLRCELDNVSHGTAEDLEYFQSLALRITSQAHWLCDSQTLDSGLLSSQWKWREKAETNKVTTRGTKRPEANIPMPHQNAGDKGFGRQEGPLKSMAHRGSHDASNWKPPDKVEKLIILMMGAIFICALQFLLCRSSGPEAKVMLIVIAIRLLPLYLALPITGERRSAGSEKSTFIKPVINFLDRCRVLEACLELPQRWCKDVCTRSSDGGSPLLASFRDSSSDENMVATNTTADTISEAVTSIESASMTGEGTSTPSSSLSSNLPLQGSTSCFSSRPPELRHEPTEARYFCDSCQLQFSSRSNLIRHKREKREKRPDAVKHTCPDCGKNFARKDYLKKHRTTQLACRNRQVRNKKRGGCL